MDIWNNEDYTITVRRERREDKPYVVNIRENDEDARGTQAWFRTVDEAMEYARSLDEQKNDNPPDALTFL